METQCLGLFRGFFVAFSWPCLGQILRVLALEKSSDLQNPREVAQLVGRQNEQSMRVRRSDPQRDYNFAFARVASYVGIQREFPVSAKGSQTSAEEIVGFLEPSPMGAPNQSLRKRWTF